ncbi:maleylacetoacetate isomerase [Sneathiella marina]|uniref:Maleylacetoacetate isomerase n=1 Tax=Sneathiella marina TaxID=2950108 RepID=A0ABY4W8C0_9PROT|nr:maleylacetoacetate isomerase [Sneathiella marina]USG61519.1 maleylacetoacetate isomerase [Sneathiella marina]
MSDIVLYDYWRSSASYRVRIALNLKKLTFQSKVVDLAAGEKLYSHNPQGYVPVLMMKGKTLTQSLSIIEYLDELYPTPPLLGETADARQSVRALAHLVAMDIHPVCNLNVVNYAADLATSSNPVKVDWMKHFIGKGMTALEQLINDAGAGPFCYGDCPTLADICLMPQIYNADRWGFDISSLKRISEIGQRCAEIEAFQKAHPDAVR